MSRPSAGTYIIYNRVLSPTGEKLAFTFTGQNKTQTVTPLSNNETQKWIIKDYNSNTQTISPESNANLQAAWGDQGVTVLPAGAYVWVIRSTDSGYTIQDGKQTVYWGVADAVDNANVTITAGTGNEKQRWIFHQA
ncbi:hypothetical protein IEO21_11077 [Rhodonia placenta]|uniref:CCL2-like lectin domain-containing protein n=1 Tax=Rhodonia placenta TaxID=104341 RepID=A0A8H7TWQ4_9APHY|nr:hypothetical protein IEO21_11077 [Postia placenta]